MRKKLEDFVVINDNFRNLLRIQIMTEKIPCLITFYIRTYERGHFA